MARIAAPLRKIWAEAGADRDGPPPGRLIGSGASQARPWLQLGAPGTPAAPADAGAAEPPGAVAPSLMRQLSDDLAGARRGAGADAAGAKTGADAFGQRLLAATQGLASASSRHEEGENGEDSDSDGGPMQRTTSDRPDFAWGSGNADQSDASDSDEGWD